VYRYRFYWRKDAGGQKPLWRIVLAILCMSRMAFAELPKPLQDALAESRESGKELQAAGVLRRYANSDEPRERVLARTALARIDREAGHPLRAQTWVKEYSRPIPENYEWPRVAASIEYAQSVFALGQTFDAVKRLNGIKDHAQGLGRIYAQRALSVISEQQPDLSKALAFEKGALSSGKRYFKREKISESAGYADHKAGHGHWKRLKPEIDERIKELERLLDIEKYGLDYVLYREAQMYRKADHPLAMDFTHVAAAFRLKEPMAAKVPGADYEKALESYALIIESFAQNPYAEAAKLYSAVCKVHMGEADQAIRDLKAFYKENPDGLYRGEALKIIGDIYLFHKWDQVNAEEAYNRSVTWLEAMKARSRILSDYLVPEKSRKVSKPPVRVKVLTEEGEIQEIAVPANALVNRNSSKWYLDALRVKVEWRLGFLDVVVEKWDQAFEHFDQVYTHDTVIRSASNRNYFNAYDRLKIGKKQKGLIGVHEQLQGLTGKSKMVIVWADFLFAIEEFQASYDLFLRIQKYARAKGDENEFLRGLLGEAVVAKHIGKMDTEKERQEIVTRMFDAVQKKPRSPSAPALLSFCARYAVNDGEFSAGQYYEMVYTQYPNSYFGPRAMYFRIIRYAPWQDHEKRGEMIDEFIRKYPNEKKYHSSLMAMDKSMRKTVKEVKEGRFLNED